MRTPTVLPDEGRYLTPNEDLVLSVRRHWAILVRPVAELLGVLTAALVAAPGAGAAIDALLGLVVLGFLARLGWAALDWWVTHIALTTRRVLELRGVIVRTVASMPFRKVTDLTYRKSPIGRLFDYGEFVVESAAQDQALSRIRFVPSPDTFYRTLMGLVFGPRSGPPGGGDAGGGDSEGA